MGEHRGRTLITAGERETRNPLGERGSERNRRAVEQASGLDSLKRYATLAARSRDSEELEQRRDGVRWIAWILGSLVDPSDDCANRPD